MEQLSVAELKALCQQRRLPVGGTKAELLVRLGGAVVAAVTTHVVVNVATTAAAAAAASVTTSTAIDYDSQTIPQLKERCREQGLAVGGNKDDLIARLRAADPRELTLAQLKARCRERGLPVTGTKPDLIERLLCRRDAPPTSTGGGINSSGGGGKAVKSAKSISVAPTSGSGGLFGLSLDELKDLCRRRGLAISGNKSELIARLEAKTPAPKPSGEINAARKSSATAAPSSSSAAQEDRQQSLEAMTIPQLKDLCRSRGLPVGGTKEELTTRLMLGSLTVPELKEVCRKMGKAVGGNRDDLLGRLASKPPSRPSSADPLSSSSTNVAASSSEAVASPAYNTMTLAQLKELCRDRTLPMTGNKDELISKLQAHDDVVRHMFKKRKGPPRKTPSVGIGAAARSALPKPAATKRSMKATSSAASKVKTEKPKTKQSAARRQTTAVKTESSGGNYIVYSTCAYPPDGWHSYAGPGEPKFDRVFATKEEANARVRELFYHKNPWGLGVDEMEDQDIDERCPNGLLKLSVCPPDSEEWVVAAKESGSGSHGQSWSDSDHDHDGDVRMDSDSEDDGYYGGGYDHAW